MKRRIKQNTFSPERRIYEHWTGYEMALKWSPITRTSQSIRKIKAWSSLTADVTQCCDIGSLMMPTRMMMMVISF